MCSHQHFTSEVTIVIIIIYIYFFFDQDYSNLLINSLVFSVVLLDSGMQSGLFVKVFDKYLEL